MCCWQRKSPGRPPFPRRRSRLGLQELQLFYPNVPRQLSGRGHEFRPSHDIPNPEQAINRLSAYYDGAVRALREAIAAFIERGEIPDDAARAAGGFVYPALHVSWDGEGQPAERTRAYGRFNHPGHYVTTITRPELFRGYLLEQLTLLVREYGARIEVHPSQQEIPYPYVIDGAELALDRMMSAALARHFPIPNLAHIGDETADGALLGQQDAPLSHFDALRTDFSLARLRHYTGTPPEHVQPYILFTNYSRYVDEFVRWACRQIASPTAAIARSLAPGGSISMPTMSTATRWSPIWHGKITRCRPTI
ncbi:AMP nucleosidase [Edwardsiella tarda]|nr:AMP nucleosidase [Edwardsiella tarda]